MKCYSRKFWVVNNKKYLILLTFFLFFLVVIFCWLFLVSNILVENKKLEFYIKKNTSFTEFFKIISPHLKSKTSFRLASKLKKFDKNIKPGRYIIEKSMNNNQLINNLRVNNIPVNLTFNNLERIENLATKENLVFKGLKKGNANDVDSFYDGKLIKTDNNEKHYNSERV